MRKGAADYLRRALAPLLGLLALCVPASPASCEEVLRACIRVDLEPVWAAAAGLEYPLSAEGAVAQAFEESILFFSGSIYGWSFIWEPGSRERAIEEHLELTSLGEIGRQGDQLSLVSSQEERSILTVWTEYRLDALQKSRRDAWRAADTKATQATGSAPLSVTGKRDALENAVAQALRSLLRSTERNRPKEVRGRISLTATPRYWIAGGHWNCAGRFSAVIEEIVPFAVY